MGKVRVGGGWGFIVGCLDVCFGFSAFETFCFEIERVLCSSLCIPQV